MRTLYLASDFTDWGRADDVVMFVPRVDGPSPIHSPTMANTGRRMVSRTDDSAKGYRIENRKKKTTPLRAKPKRSLNPGRRIHHDGSGARNRGNEIRVAY